VGDISITTYHWLFFHRLGALIGLRFLYVSASRVIGVCRRLESLKIGLDVGTATYHFFRDLSSSCRFIFSL